MERERRLGVFIEQGGGTCKPHPKCWLMFSKWKWQQRDLLYHGALLFFLFFVNSDSLILRNKEWVQRSGEWCSLVLHPGDNTFPDTSDMVEEYFFHAMQKPGMAQENVHIYIPLWNFSFSMIYPSGVFPALYPSQPRRRRKWQECFQGNFTLECCSI